MAACTAIAGEVASLTVAREVTKFTHTASGQYIALEYAQRPQLALSVDLGISVAGGKKAVSMNPWETVASVCEVSKLNAVLSKADFLDAKASVEETLGKIAKQIVSEREKLLACEVDTVAITLVQEDTLPSGEGTGQRVTTLFSTIYNIKGRFASIKAQELSRFRSQSFPLASPPPRFQQSEATKIHAEKLFTSFPN
jgi:hypothetical protein